MKRSLLWAILAATVVRWTAACGTSAAPGTAPPPPNDASAPGSDGGPPAGDAGGDDGGPATARIDLLIDDDWKFNKGDVPGAEAPTFDDAQWESVHLPHTWNATDGQAGGGAYHRGIGVYRRHLTRDAAYAEKRLFLRFDGANLVTRVWVNGQELEKHKGGYAAFAYDVTSGLDSGKDNVIAVKVDNSADPDTPPLTADYTFFGGLYRDAHLIVTDALHVDLLDHASPGVYLTPANVSAASADVAIAVNVRNDRATDAEATVRASILDADGKVVATSEMPAQVKAGSTVQSHGTAKIASPHLWNGRPDPYLYRVRVDVSDASGARGVLDSVTQPLGLRTYSVDASSGFSLNGKPLDLHGVNRHQDRLDKGWAITNKEHDEDFALIAEIGATAIRLAHYEHAAHFYDLADAAGMVVWAEIPLINSISSSQAFADNAKQQLVELIRQNYNHPSIFFWSIANEISLAAGPDYNSLLSALATTVESEDPSRHSALASTGNGTDYTHPYVAGFNRYEGWYYGVSADFGGWADTMHAHSPTLRFGVTEYGAGASTAFHAEAPVMGDHTEEYQAMFHESHWAQMKARPYLWGKFIWAMFDFASSARNEGDAPGRNDKGLVTYDRKTKKDAFFFYKANWTTDPFVYITGRRFAKRAAAKIDIKVYAVADSVDVTLNGKSLGPKSAPPSGSGGVFVWSGVTLATGSNTVIATGTAGTKGAGGGQTFTDQVVWTH
jgi:beta-galactosidase